MYSAISVYLVTGVLKLISAGGASSALNLLDPFFSLKFKHLFVLVGLLEITVALICVFYNSMFVKLQTLFWLTFLISFYRLSLFFINYHRPCNCLGTLTESLHISPDNADMLMKAILIYLLVGGFLSLCWLYLWHRKHPAE